MSKEELAKKAALISSTRILSQEEFRRAKAAQLAKQIQAAKPRKFNKNSNNKEEVDAELLPLQQKEVVSLNSIEKIYKKSKSDKESRLATVLAGREDRGKFGGRKEKLNPFASKNKNQTKKNKAFMMVKYKIKSKKKKSFKEKQIALRNSLLRKCK